MRKATEGPWICERQDHEEGDIYFAIHAAKGYEFICNVSESEANARLIAAAPELLAAAIEVHRCGNAGAKLSRKASDMVRAAILKAAEGK